MEKWTRTFGMGGQRYTNLFDIACGFTPRSIYCARAKIDYVGVDVPVVAEELEQLAVELGLSQKHPTYMGADATNGRSSGGRSGQSTGCADAPVVLKKRFAVVILRGELPSHVDAWHALFPNNV